MTDKIPESFRKSVNALSLARDLLGDVHFAGGAGPVLADIFAGMPDEAFENWMVILCDAINDRREERKKSAC